MTTPPPKVLDEVLTLPMGDDAPKARLVYGDDVRVSLRKLDTGSVHTVVTSPPYFRMRKYGDYADQIGLEDTPDAFVGALVEVFREVKRVLRTDGTLWLNLGDSYAGSGKAGSNPEYQARHTMFGSDAPGTSENYGLPSGVPPGLKNKDLMMVPHRVAMALQADGWYLRSVIPWLKWNCMPESITDRPTSALEYVFLLSHPEGGGKYYYDSHAVKKPLSEGSLLRLNQPTFARQTGGEKDYANVPGGNASRSTRKSAENMKASLDAGTSGRNRRNTDWFFESCALVANRGEAFPHDEAGDPLALVVNPRPYAGAHFAVMPTTLVEPMIRASTSEHGVCSTCGAPWERVVTRGWQPTCACPCAHVSLKRAVVLDPFSGSGTTAHVATSLNRDAVGLDLNPEYLPLARARVMGVAAPSQEGGAQGDSAPLDALTELFGGD